MNLGACRCTLPALRCEYWYKSYRQLPPNCLVNGTNITRFKRMSIERFGTVDIDGLWLLRSTNGDYPRFADFEERNDVTLVGQQWYRHVRGTEYLAANPIDIPKLRDLLESQRQQSSDVVFEPLVASKSAKDPFQALSPELRALLLELLASSDVANLRLSSKAFSQLPQTYFKHLIRQEMPWVWELHDTNSGIEPKRGLDWFALWWHLWTNDGGYCGDEVARAEIEEGQPIYHPFKFQIKGLRNRRMIYEDISIILDMMADARAELAE